MRMRDIQDLHILRTFIFQHYSRTHTARALGVGLRTVQRTLTRLKIPLGDSGYQHKERMEKYEVPAAAAIQLIESKYKK